MDQNTIGALKCLASIVVISLKDCKRINQIKNVQFIISYKHLDEPKITYNVSGGRRFEIDYQICYEQLTIMFYEEHILKKEAKSDIYELDLDSLKDNILCFLQENISE